VGGFNLTDPNSVFGNSNIGALLGGTTVPADSPLWAILNSRAMGNGAFSPVNVSGKSWPTMPADPLPQAWNDLQVAAAPKLVDVFGAWISAGKVNDIPAVLATRKCINITEADFGPTPGPRFGYEQNCFFWESAETIDGDYTDTQFSAFQEGSVSSEFSLWTNEVQRAVHLVLVGGVTFKGITLNRYQIDPAQLLNASVNPANNKYLQFLGPGIIPMQRYYGGADLFLSQPHFLGCDVTTIKSRLDPTSTISPVDDFNVHKTYLDIEPYTGKTFSARKRLQVGIMLSGRRYAKDGPYGKIIAGYPNHRNPIFVPIVWAEEGNDITDSDASSFVTNVYDLRTMVKNAMIGGIVAGAAFGIIMVFVACCVHRRQKGAQKDYMGGTTL